MEEACGLSPQRCEFESRLGYKSRKRLVYAPVAERNTHCAKDAGFEGSNPSGCMPVWWNGIHTCFRNKVFWVRIPVRVRRQYHMFRWKRNYRVLLRKTSPTWKRGEAQTFVMCGFEFHRLYLKMYKWHCRKWRITKMKRKQKSRKQIILRL